MSEEERPVENIERILIRMGYFLLVLLLVIIYLGISDIRVYSVILLILILIISYGWAIRENKTGYRALLEEHACTTVLEGKFSMVLTGEIRPEEFKRDFRRCIEKVKRTYPLILSPEKVDLTTLDNNVFIGLIRVTEFYRDTIGQDDIYSEGNLLIGNYYFFKGDYTTSLEKYEESLRWEPFPSAWINKGLQEHLLGRHEDAIKSFDIALNISRDIWQGHYYRTLALMALEGYEDALDSIDKAIKLRPGVANLLSTKGRVYEGLGQLGEGLYFLRMAVDIAPDNLEIQYLIARNLHSQEDLDGSLEVLNNIIEQRKDVADVWVEKGDVLGELGRHEEALQCYDKALTLDYQNPLIWSNRGLGLGHLGKHDEAIMSFDEALDLDPKDSTSWYNKGNALYFLGRYEEALVCFNKAMEIDPDDPVTLYRRGESLISLGRQTMAIKDINRALELDPHMAGAWFDLAHLYMQKRWVKKAKEALLKAMTLDRHYKGIAETTPEFDTFREEDWFKGMD